jgi:hypothetical protein
MCEAILNYLISLIFIFITIFLEFILLFQFLNNYIYAFIIFSFIILIKIFDGVIENE